MWQINNKGAFRVKNKANKTHSLAMIAVVYLAGIFMGAIDTGIVTPARTIIQNNLMVDDKTGIWLITIYTLAYAASIPVMGKLADRYGRKKIYITSIALFGLGSLLCGLSRYTGSFSLLIAARAIQAIGGGGIMPVATAEFGTSFPIEKRGMALGLIGGVYGIANIFGSLAGSAILDLFGTSNWQYIFFVNIPISIFIIIAGIFVLPDHKEKAIKKIDGLGTLTIVIMVLSLLYGLKQIDFFDFSNSITSTGVYPFLLLFAVLVPIFILIEKKAEDPIINLRYFTNVRIVATLAVSFASGFVLMGIVFIPQFCENSLKVASGDGGYFTVILGLLSGVSAMLSGKLIDKIGAKLVLLIGFSISIIGALFLIFVAAVNPSMLTVVISLMLLGFGMGFTIGAPVNYMMLENIKDSESNSGLATLSLIRSIGTSIAPAIMVGFIAHAGLSVQANLMAELPNQINMPTLPYVQDISDKLASLKADPNMASKLGNVDIPDLTSMQTIKIDFTGNSDFTMPEDILNKLKSSDVTTIVGITKEMSSSMFDEMTPPIMTKIQSGLDSGIEGINSGISGMDESLTKLQAAYSGINKGIAGMPPAAQPTALAQQKGLAASIAQISSAKTEMETLVNEMTSLSDAIPGAFETAKQDYLKEIDARSDKLQEIYQSTLNKGYQSIYFTVIVSAALAILLLLFYKKRETVTGELTETEQ
jgi:EmrB/QacA subfamily drug resistance transporter